jgi:hypothetical protein
MREYQKFPIQNFRTGFNESVEPWLLPHDSYPYLRNAHLYRGVLEKIQGYLTYARMSYTQTVTLTGTIDGSNKVFTGTLSPLPSTNSITATSAINVGGTVSESFQYGSDTLPDIINLVSNLAGTGTVNMTTGAVTLTFNTAPAKIPGGGNLYNSVRLTYDYLANPGAGLTDIMGIKQYYAANGSQQILVFDTRRAGKIIVLSGIAADLAQADNGVEEIPHEVDTRSIVVAPAFNGVAVTFTGTISAPIVPGSVGIYLYTSANVLRTSITDNGSSLLTGVANDSTVLTNPNATGFINYATGAFTITFTLGGARTAPAAGDTLNSSVCQYGNTFTGDYTNFFSVANYQYYAFITNGIDAIRYYDGTCLKYLNTNTDPNALPFAPYLITTCLHVAINRERLLLILPKVNTTPEQNNIRWSKAGAPLDFTNAEFLLAPTSEPIKLFSFINSDMIVRFLNSERIFTYTQDAFAPFRWDTTNSLFRCDTRYSAINYDKFVTSVGKAAIVASDGVNVQRADEIIPDFTLADRELYDGPIISIEQKSIDQCYGERFDDFKEGWLCFKDSRPTNSDIAERSDNVLAFNYMDDTYAVYTFPFNCLGFGVVNDVDTWGNNFDKWGVAYYAWGGFFEGANELEDLGGDRNGVIYRLGEGNLQTDEAGNFVPISFDVLSKNFNPFIADGQKCVLGYVDLLVSASPTTTLRLQFFASDTLELDTDGLPLASSAYQETALTFFTTDAMSSAPQTKVWKRVYVGVVAKAHAIRFYQNDADLELEPSQPVRIHNMTLYMKPAGIIFQ